MAKYWGTDGRIKIGANTVAEVERFSFEGTADVQRAAAQGDTGWTKKADIPDANGTVEGFYDPADSNGQGQFREGGEVTLIFYPTGIAAGRVEITIDAVFNSWQFLSARGEFVTFTASWEANGAPVFDTY